MKFKNMLWSSALLYSGSLLAHGEDRPGPHGGLIRMPGAFHTEVIQVNNSSVRVYLLDMNFQKPTVQNSVLEVKHVGSQITEGICEKETVSYLCTFKDADLKSKGELVIKPVRDNQRGVSISYQTPFNNQGERQDK